MHFSLIWLVKSNKIITRVMIFKAANLVEFYITNLSTSKLDLLSLNYTIYKNRVLRDAIPFIIKKGE